MNSQAVGPPKLHRATMVAVIVLMWVIGMFGEHVQTGGGLGWDGQVYARLVRDLPALLNSDQLPSYYGHRLIPIALVHAFSRENVMLGFQVMNLAASLLSLWAWLRLSRKVALSSVGCWLGFAALFLSFQGAKLSHFNPVLIDNVAIATALVMLVLYLEQRILALAAWTILASLVWSTAAITGAALIGLCAASGEPVPSRRWWWILASVAVLAAIALFLALEVPSVCALANGAAANFVAEAGRGDGACGAMQAVLTAIASISIVAPAGLMLLGWPRSLRWRYAALGVVVLAATTAINVLLTNPDLPGGTDARLMARFILLPQIGKFFLPMISIALFWGPLALAAAVMWSETVRSAWRIGPGMAVAMGLALPLMLVTEPRFIIFQWPFIVLATVLAVQDRFDRRLAIGFAILVFLFSKAWLRINYAPWVGADYAGLHDWPKQMYFMNFGFWMSWLPFLVQSCVIALATVWLHRSLARTRAAPAGPLPTAAPFHRPEAASARLS